MSDDRWKRLQSIFEGAQDLDAEAREKYLQEQCGPDGELRREVEELISFGGESPTFAPIFTPDQAPELDEGTAVGPFRLIREIGAGGMGRVYEAEQDAPKRTVAVKMLKLAFASDSDRRRFGYETEALARLRHPNVAQLFQVGTHVVPGSLGQELPYFAMEYVPGARTLRAYVSEHKIGVHDKLRLFCEICEAIHHGHQKGVLHRDVKPANVLVSSEGQVKVIDFGIAQALDPEQDVTRLTARGAFIGTPAYMSPEQLVQDEACDVRSDVYSLGVVLYELLSGDLPHDLTDTPVHAVAQVVQEQPIRSLRDRAGVPAELDWIAGRALEADAARRYDTALALCADVRRFLNHEALEAGPPSVIYRMRKFARRHRLVVGFSSVVLVALIVGLIGVTMALNRISKEHAQKTHAVEFFTEMLSAGDPEVGGHETRLFDAVRQNAGRIDREFVDQPEVRELLHAAVGNMYGNLGYYDQAAPHLRTAFDLSSELYGRSTALSTGAGGSLVSVWMHTGRLEEAHALARDVIAERTKLLGPGDRATARAHRNLGTLQLERGEPREALESYRTAYALARKHRGDRDAETLHISVYVVRALYDLHQFAESKEILERSWSLVQEVAPDNPVLQLALRNQLALLHLEEGSVDQAEQLLREGLDRSAGPMGDRHPERLRLRHNLAHVYSRRQEHDSASAELEQVIRGFRAELGGDHLDTLKARLSRAGLWYQQGRAPESEAEAREVREVLRRTVGDRHSATLSAGMTLALALASQGKGREAEAELEHVVDTAEPYHGQADPLVLRAKSNLGALYTRGQRHGDAERLLREVYRARVAADEKDPNLLTVMNNIAHALMSQEKNEEAQAFLGEVIERAQSMGRSLHHSVLTARSNLASLLNQEKLHDQAAHQYEEILKIRQETLGPDHPRTILSINNLAVTYQKQGDFERAAQWLKRVTDKTRGLDGFDPVMRAQFQYNHGQCLYKLNRFEEALTVFAECHKTLERLSGAADEWTIAAKEMIDDIQARLAK